MIKRLIALIPLLIAVISCCKDNLGSQEESPTRLQKEESITRTKENALNIALKAQEEFFGTSTRSKIKVIVSIFDDGVAHLNKNIVILTNFKPIKQ